MLKGTKRNTDTLFAFYFSTEILNPRYAGFAISKGKKNLNIKQRKSILII